MKGKEEGVREERKKGGREGEREGEHRKIENERE